MDLSSAESAWSYITQSPEFSLSSEGISCIDSFLSSDRSDTATLHSLLHTLDAIVSPRWEHVALSCLLHLRILQMGYEGADRVCMKQISLCIEHTEPRVRSLACRLIHQLAKSYGFQVFDDIYDIILLCVSANEERETTTRPVVLGNETEVDLDEVTGWRALETSYTAFKELIRGTCQYVQGLNEELPLEGREFLWRRSSLIPLDAVPYDKFITSAALHVNRYVRQACCELISVLCVGCPAGGIPPQPATEYVAAVRDALAIGLQDSWCQVRLAATQATGAFLGVLFPPSVKDAVWPLVLPRLCLNRHYSTDSVRTAAHQAWARGVGHRGRELLAIHSTNTVEHYICMTRHKNHMVCEAACAAMAEIATRVDPEAVNPQLPVMLASLRDSLADASWPVRDSTCTAIGRFLRGTWTRLPISESVLPLVLSAPSAIDIVHGRGPRPEETQDESVAVSALITDVLNMLFSYLLREPFRPVRDSAAVGIVDSLLRPPPLPNISISTDAIQSGERLQQEVWGRLETYLDSHILTATGNSVPIAPGTLTGKGKLNKNFRFIPDAMVAQMMGQAPKSRVRRPRARKGGGWGCCLDCAAGEDKEPSPCEVSDSCLLLLREIGVALAGETGELSSADCERATAVVRKHIENVWKLLTVTGFSDSHRLHTSVYQQLPVLLRYLSEDDRKATLCNHVNVLQRDLSMSSEECFRQETRANAGKKSLSSVNIFSPLKTAAVTESTDKIAELVGRDFFHSLCKTCST